jgi:hypothetical protein
MARHWAYENRTGGHGRKCFILLPEKEFFPCKVCPDLSGREKLGKHHPAIAEKTGKEIQTCMKT